MGVFQHIFDGPELFHHIAAGERHHFVSGKDQVKPVQMLLHQGLQAILKGFHGAFVGIEGIAAENKGIVGVHTAGKEDLVLQVQEAEAAGGMTGGVDHFHLMAAAQIEHIAIVTGHQGVGPIGNQVLPGKDPVQSLAVFVHHAVPNMGVHVLGGNKGHRVGVAVDHVKLVVAKHMVPVLMGIDHVKGLVPDELLYQALQVTDACTGIHQQGLLGTVNEMQPHTAAALDVLLIKAVHTRLKLKHSMEGVDLGISNPLIRNGGKPGLHFLTVKNSVMHYTFSCFSLTPHRSVLTFGNSGNPEFGPSIS